MKYSVITLHGDQCLGNIEDHRCDENEEKRREKNPEDVNVPSPIAAFAQDSPDLGSSYAEDDNTRIVIIYGNHYKQEESQSFSQSLPSSRTPVH